MSNSYEKYSHLFSTEEWERAIELTLSRPLSLSQAIKLAGYRVRIFQTPFMIFRIPNNGYREIALRDLEAAYENHPEYIESAIVLADQRAYIFGVTEDDDKRNAVTEPIPTPAKTATAPKPRAPRKPRATKPQE